MFIDLNNLILIFKSFCYILISKGVVMVMKMNMENVQTHMTAQINANIKIYSFYSSNVEDI